MSFELLRPDRKHLPGFLDALERRWSPDNVRGEAAARELLEAAARDPDALVASLHDPEGTGPPIELPDGSIVRRLPGFHRWIWDGEFCGTIGFRWAPGTEALPAHVLGHIGYAVTPWKQGRGYATAALRAVLPLAAARGLRWVELTTDPHNLASQKVILANGGRLVERFFKPGAYGGSESLKYRIDLATAASCNR